MISPAQLNGLLGRFDIPDIKSLPAGLCTDAASLMGVTDCTLAFIGATSRLTLCASSDDAMSLDNWQFSLDEGPCLDAARTGTSHWADLTDNKGSPWPQLERKARLIGYTSLAGIPLQVGGLPFGAMNVQNRSLSFGTENLADAERVAQALSQPIVTRMSESLPPGFDQAGYDNVHRASGMVSVQMGIPVDDAMAVLRAHAWSTDQQLIAVAREVTTGALRFGPGTGPSRD